MCPISFVLTWLWIPTATNLYSTKSLNNFLQRQRQQGQHIIHTLPLSFTVNQNNCNTNFANYLQHPHHLFHVTGLCWSFPRHVCLIVDLWRTAYYSLRCNVAVATSPLLQPTCRITRSITNIYTHKNTIALQDTSTACQHRGWLSNCAELLCCDAICLLFNVSTTTAAHHNTTDNQIQDNIKTTFRHRHQQ